MGWERVHPGHGVRTPRVGGRGLPKSLLFLTMRRRPPARPPFPHLETGQQCGNLGGLGVWGGGCAAPVSLPRRPSAQQKRRGPRVTRSQDASSPEPPNPPVRRERGSERLCGCPRPEPGWRGRWWWKSAPGSGSEESPAHPRPHGGGRARQPGPRAPGLVPAVMLWPLCGPCQLLRHRPPRHPARPRAPQHFKRLCCFKHTGFELLAPRHPPLRGANPTDSLARSGPLSPESRHRVGPAGTAVLGRTVGA